MSVMRNNVVFLFAGVLFFAGSVFAISGITQFVFLTNPQTIRPLELSGALKIQAQDANGTEIKTEETIDLTFSSTSLTGEFLNASSSPVSTVMNKGTANRTFYYQDSNSGIYTLTVKAKGRDSGTSWTVSQTITISDAAVASSISAPPTPSGVGAPTGSVGATPSPTPTPSSSLSGSSPSSKINVDAGVDQTATVGSEVHFNGSTTGLKKEPLDQARFWWNFGDGETQEGKFTTHIFRIPGTYIVGLHVSSGEYAASDYVTVHALANQMRVSRVLEGGAGYIGFLNPLNVESDIGDWIIEDATQKKFFIPPETKIAAGAEISFSNAVTGLLQTDTHEPSALYPLTVQYPNGTVAFTYTPAASGSPVVSASVAHSTSYPRPELGSKAGQATAPARSFSKERALPYQAGEDREQADAKKDVMAPDTQSVALSGGISISSRILFAGAIGLSVLGAVGFFVLKQFLI